MTLPRSLQAVLFGAVLSLSLSPPAAAQDPPKATEPEGVNSGNYNIHQSVEFGYRNSDISGNLANYDTFVNLNSGVRLFEQSVDIRSLNHSGFLFDNLSMNSFGYGGDPNNVTRLRVGKNKWYDFRSTFRRDKYPWNYNLLANPLNPGSSTPAVPITNSLHALYLVRRMSDFDLTLLPQSRIKFRLGYTRNIQEGPSFTTFGGATLLDPPLGFGTQTQLFQNWKTTLNAYHFGVDFQVLRKTSFHYDQFLQYFKQDTSYVDRHQQFQLPNGVPVDLGVTFDTASGVNPVPCPSPVANASTNPPTADPSCNGYLTLTRTGRPRSSLPTEQFSFQSESIKNVSMSGRAAYSSGSENSSDLNETFFGSNVSTLQVGTNATGPTHAKRVIANVDWAVTWAITPKFRLVDSFTYDHFQIPGFWNLSTVSLFAQAPLDPTTGGPILGQPPGRFDPTDCPPPFSAPTCPQHNADSGPDILNGNWNRYLAQSTKSNTIQLEYDFTNKFGARLGYRYGTRKVLGEDGLTFTSEVLFPGGPAGAARGDCADPAACTLQPDGSLVFSGFSGDDSHQLDADIKSHSMLAGFWARPTSSLRFSFDTELFWADSAFARIDPRQQQRYRFQAAYNPASWITLDASFDILEHRNNMALVNDKEHDRGYSFSAVLTPNERFSFDFGYTYSDIYFQILECWAYGSGVTFPVAPGLLPSGTTTTPCPIPAEVQGPDDVTAFGGTATYSSKTHFAYGDVMWKPIKRLTLKAGYAGSFADGNTLFLNPNAPVGPLRYTYQKPYAGFAFELAKGLTYKTTWAYYGYNPRSLENPAGLAPIGSQDFNGNNVTLALRYAF
jgi:hypothetical protein